ncbi:protein lifeguard 3 [Chelonoidis abingdonii]|uniref:protein lifeguard 3 n=1 Tax=Chelonoidis abingdonii TaxID=106734 RepID=UPI0013F1D56C|nr:protein lifeguard 3-like [Chelonoidis abingdonii]
MSYPSAPPPYDDKNPLYPPQPGGHPQPGAYPGGYPQPAPYPGGYPQPGGYPGGYPQPGGYPHPGVPPMSTVPMNLGDSYGSGGSGEEDGLRASTWDDKSVRHTFIRKVYTIISVQLLVTVGIIAVFTFVKRFPWNLILLSIFTLAMAFMTGAIASWYKTEAVLITMVITAIVAIIVTVFCFQTKVDFTSCTGLFCVLGIVVTVTGIITAIVLSFTYVKWLHMLYAAIGAIVFTLFLAYNTQLVLGNRKNAISPEEYVYGAMEIYMNIVQIFIFLLQIVGRS